MVINREQPTQAASAAYCDVDGTLADTTIVEPLIEMKRGCLGPGQQLLWLASLCLRAPWWWVLDQISRRASNYAIYANYRGLPVRRTCELAEAYYEHRLKPKLFPEAVARLESYRARGVRVVLVTGGLDLFMRPLAQEFGADYLAPSLEERDGVFTGLLRTGPLAGESKVAAIRQHAAQHHLDLQCSYALGDAMGDLPMLECVGFPNAINPDRRLARIAARRGWPTEHWTLDSRRRSQRA